MANLAQPKQFSISHGAAGAHQEVPSTRLGVKMRGIASTLVFMAPALVFFVLFSYVPFFRSIWLSLNITDASGAASQFNGLAYYSRILALDGSGRTEYLEAMLTTVKFTMMVVPGGVLAGMIFALLAAGKVRGIKIFRTIFTASIAISLASSGVIWGMLFNPSLNVFNGVIDALNLSNPGLLNNAATALPALALMTIWSGIGFNFLITLAGIQGIPGDVYESGLIDGTNVWTAFRFITLPLLAPTLLFLLVINTIGAFQAFTQFNVLMGGSPGPEGSTNVFVFAAYRAFWLDNRYGFASALSIVLFVVLFALSFIQFRGLDKRVHYQ